MMIIPACPCPYCGELQTYDEAIPSKPKVSDRYVDRVVRGKLIWRRDTYYDMHCRACGQHIVWTQSFQPGQPTEFSWSGP